MRVTSLMFQTRRRQQDSHYKIVTVVDWQPTRFITVQFLTGKPTTVHSRYFIMVFLQQQHIFTA